MINVRPGSKVFLHKSQVLFILTYYFSWPIFSSSKPSVDESQKGSVPKTIVEPSQATSSKKKDSGGSAHRCVFIRILPKMITFLLNGTDF